ncbi:MAG: oligosaccharide flippase family protein [Aquabacterium sp.]|nr:oligosaccharide flippase family protein [Aquabacterium sp.]
MNLPRLLGKLMSVTALRVGVAGLGFSLFWLISHYFSASELGGFSLLMSVFLFLQMLPLLGLNVHVIREMAAHPENQADEISVAAVFASVVGTLMALSLVAWAWLAPGVTLHMPLTLLGLAMLPSAWILVAEATLVGLEKLSVLTTVNLFENAWRLLGAAISIWQGWGLTGVFAFFLVGRVLAAAGYAWFGGLPSPNLARVSTEGLRRYLSLTPTYLVIGVVAAACSRIDVMLLSQLRGLEEVAVYAAAAKLYEASLMVSTMALMIVYPVLSRLFVSDAALFASTLARSLRWFFLAAPIVMVGMALASPLVHLLYAPALWSSVPVLQALLLGSWLMAIDQLLSGTMLAAHAQRHDLRAMLVGLITLASGLALLTPWLGPVGAAWAVVAGLALRVLWRVRWAERQLRLDGVLSQALRAYLSTAISVGCFLYGNHAGLQVFVSLVAACAVHAVVTQLTGAFDATHRSDWNQWRHKTSQNQKATT